MGIKINFDTANNPELPTFVLAKRSGEKIGLINNITDVNIKDPLNDAAEISFTVHKYNNNNEFCPYWNQIKDFRLVWCKEWDVWFEMTVAYEESDDTIKSCSLIRLGEAELSQPRLFDVEINTEDDIARDDYIAPTVLYNKDDKSISLLDRILHDKAPHYSIVHVDPSIAYLSRTFSFDNISIKDAFDEIAKEYNCLFVYDSNSDEDGNIKRTISVYDLESYCIDCYYRDELLYDVCPKCGKHNIAESLQNYKKKDTAICVSGEDLGEDITLEVDKDSVKNCFKLLAGDDLMTATIVNCTPSGSGYIWNIPQFLREDMSQELQDKLNSYDKLQEYYQNDYESNLEENYISFSQIISNNNLIKKYNVPSTNAFASSTYLENTYMPYEAFDFNVLNTMWASKTSPNADGEYIGIDLLKPLTINRVAIVWDGYMYGKTIKIQTSNNKITWNTAQTFHITWDETKEDRAAAVYILDNEVNARYIRVHMSEPNIQEVGYRIRQVALYYKKNIIAEYNALVEKYKDVYEIQMKKVEGKLNKIELPIKGHSQIMRTYYDTVDFANFLMDTYMPTWELSDTSAEEQAKLLTSDSLSPVAVAGNDYDYTSSSTADSAVLSMVKVLIDYRYKVEIANSSYNSVSKMWTGSFVVTNYSDDEDRYQTGNITITINNEYEDFIKQKIKKTLNKNKKDFKADILELFGADTSIKDLENELPKYCLNSLISFHDACQTCIDVLITMKDTIKDSDVCDKLYTNYHDKLVLIEGEIQIRENEVDIITGEFSNDTTSVSQNLAKDSGNHITSIQSLIREEIDRIHDVLDIKKHLGDNWIEFSAYRREDLYENTNYISDGSDNIKLFKDAQEFIETANKDIYKSANLQHKITAKLKNLLAIKEFEPLVDNFECGNWIRVKIDDTLYKLRLLEYNIDYENLQDLSVTFSDVVNVITGTNTIQNILNQASNMATSYESVKRQASDGSDSANILNNWFERGLEATNTRIVSDAYDQNLIWDEHGLLCRQYDDLLSDYNPKQIKIINKGIYFTRDNWGTINTALGNFYYLDPSTSQLTEAYGLNAETIVGKLIIGNELGIYNENQSMKFDSQGLVISNGTNTVTINPNSDSVLTITNNENQKLLSFNKDSGDLSVTGEIISESGKIGNWDITKDGLECGDDNAAYLKLDSNEKSFKSKKENNYTELSAGHLLSENISNQYKVELTSGSLCFYRGETAYAKFSTAYWEDKPEYYGVGVHSEKDSKFISFGNKNIDSKENDPYITNLVLNYGLDPNGCKEDVLIYGKSRLDGDSHFYGHIDMKGQGKRFTFYNGLDGNDSRWTYLYYGTLTHNEDNSIHDAICASNDFVCRGDGYFYKNLWINNGNIVSGTQGSDVRIKKNILSVDNVKNLYLGFKPKQYSFKDTYIKGKNIRNDNIYFGLIAQEVQSNFKKHGLDISKYNIVEENECCPNSDEYGYIRDGKKLYVNYDNLHAFHIAFGQEIYKEFTDKIEYLEGKIKELESLIQ